MKKQLIVLVGITLGLMFVAGCGKKGPLEPPPNSVETPKADNSVKPPKTGPQVTPTWPGGTAQGTP
jgi:predicted small lipoprotein YifL